MICDACQRELPEPKVLGPTRCKCGNWIDAGFPVACHHRGPRLGQASCGCGAVYRCNLLGIFCGNKQPLEFADFQGTILDETNFRCCRGCAEFVTD